MPDRDGNHQRLPDTIQRYLGTDLDMYCISMNIQIQYYDFFCVFFSGF